MMNIQNLTGQTIGQYQIRAMLGSGGMGTVYRAFQATLKREVAFKILPPEFVSQGDYAERFVREAQTAASLEHSHIVPIFDYGTIDGVTFVVMRLLSGGTLNERLKRHAEAGQALPSLAEISGILKQLASALDYAHSKGIIHRDIKASNVMFDNLGSAFIVDFGIAKLVNSAVNLTQTGVSIGTPSYMAPEQWRGEEVTPAADQYALGVLIYALVTGHLPYEANTPYALMHKHLNEPLTPPQVWRAGLPQALQQVLERSMSKLPQDRFPTVTAFAKAFDHAISGRESIPTGFFTAPLPSGPVLTTERIIPVSDTGTRPKSDAVPWYKQPLILGIIALITVAVILGLVILLPKNAATPTSTATLAAQIAINPTSTAPHTITPVPPTVTPTSSFTPTWTPTLTATSTASLTPTATLTFTVTPSITPSATSTATATATLTQTLKPEVAAQLTFSAINTLTATAWTATPTPNATQTFVAVLTALYNKSLTETATLWTPTNTSTYTPTATATFTPTATHTPTFTPTPTVTFTFTPTPTLFRGNNACGVAPNIRLVVGQQGRNTFGGGETHVRDAPRGNNLYILQEGELFDVLDGPVCRESNTDRNLNWWYIRVLSNGIIGWVPEGNQTDYWIEPALAQPPVIPREVANQLAFRSYRDGNWEIYVMRADGSKQTNLTQNVADDQFPAWSPDGQQIAFVSNRQKKDDDVFIMNADGSGVRNLTDRREKDTVPVWSPDGTEIAFVSARKGNWEVFAMGIDGSNIRNLTNDTAEDFTPAWSPDGKRILFHSNRDGNFEIYVMNVDGLNVQRLTNSDGDDFAPSWSPDGQRIAFQSNRDGDVEIYSMNSDGTNVTQLTNNRKVDDANPDWSPDGTQIAFASNRDGNFEIYIMNADGTDQQRITNNPANDSSPVWRPSGDSRG